MASELVNSQKNHIFKNFPMKTKLKDANLVILVFDSTNLDSFQNLSEWYSLVKKANQNKALPGTIIKRFFSNFPMKTVN